MRRALLRLASLLALGLALQALGQSKAAAQALPAGTSRALLLRGADPVKGLPFFAPNALAALSGAYVLGGSPPAGATTKEPEILVWYTSETLVLPASWKKAAFFGPTAFALARPQGSVLVLKGSLDYLFFDYPSTLDEAAVRTFVSAFERKFRVFLQNAATASELSFPAYVDY